jgi:hypothetical protein
MNKETKRQHFVPRTYLKNFAQKHKKAFKINVVEKANLSKFFFTNIINVCLENDFYTLNGKTKEEHLLIESFYSDLIEDQYDEIYKILIDPSKREITPEIHEKIISCVITMMYRTTRWVHLHNEFMNKVLEKMFSLCQQTNKDYFIYEGERYSIANKSLKQVQCEFREGAKMYQIVLQIDVALRLISIRHYDGILVSKLLDENHLITSDNPVTLSNLQGGRIAPFDPENMISLPLDSKHLLTIMPHSESAGIHHITRINATAGMSVGKMISNNASQYVSCHKHLLGSKKGLTEYIQNKERYEAPATPAQMNNLNEIFARAKALGILK